VVHQRHRLYGFSFSSSCCCCCCKDGSMI
jgi:hypothetical protein